MADEQVPDLAVVKSPPRRSLEYATDLAGQMSDEPVGTGGQTVVYEATLADADPPDRVAVRQIGETASQQTADWDATTRFHEQIKKWVTLARRERTDPQWSDSDHIVGVVDIGEQLPWAALEFMDGGSLRERLEDNPDGLPVQEALWIGERLCRGLELAHANGVAHLDLKPGNILFRQTPDPTWDVPKIADWGLARGLLDESSKSMEVLSLKYAAPEQFDPETFGRPGTVTDIYQVGTVMYALLTGEPPYAGPERSVMFDIVTEELPPPPSDAREAVSRQVDAAVRTALEPRKSDRYDAVGVCKQALRACRTDRPLPPSVSRRLDSSGDTNRTAEPTSPETTAPEPAEAGIRADTDDTDDESSIELTGGNELTDDSPAPEPTEPTTTWPMFRDGPARTGHRAQASGPQDAVAVQWSYETLGPVASSPAVVDGTVYIGSYDNSVYALSAEDGTEQWAFQTGGAVKSSPAVVDGTVYVGSKDNSVYALSTEDGTEQWAFQTGNWVHSSPAVVDGTVYIGSRDNSVYALAAEDGTGQWTFQTGNWVYSSPAVVDGTVYVGSNDNTVYALSVEDGTEKWALQTGGMVKSSPAVVDGTVYVGSNDNTVYALSAEDGTGQWPFQTGNWMRSSLAAVDDTVYVGGDNGTVYALSAADGTEQWAFQTMSRVTSSPAVVDGTVYVGSNDNTVYALSAEDGTEQWAFQTGGMVKSSPAVVDGTVYVGSDDNTVYALSEQ